jgi:hypothetical protein
VTYFMDYGDDWPPSPTPVPPPHRRSRLWRRCVFWILVYVAVTAAGLLAIRLAHADYLQLGPGHPAPASGTAVPGTGVRR